MHRTIRRMALISSCGVALGGFAAASAQAAVTATTLPATSVTTTSAVLNGPVGTGGLAAAYQFQYGRTRSYGKVTPIRLIGTGHGTVTVSSLISHLTPNTQYHFRLLASTGNGTYPPLVTGRGADRTFTTTALTLSGTKLTVKSGMLSVRLACAGTLTCKGKLSITTRAKVGQRFKVLTCAQTSFSIGGGRSHGLTLGVSNSCEALLEMAGNHRLNGTATATLVTARLTSEPHGLSQPVTLTLK